MNCRHDVEELVSGLFLLSNSFRWTEYYTDWKSEIARSFSKEFSENCLTKCGLLRRNISNIGTAEAFHRHSEIPENERHFSFLNDPEKYFSKQTSINVHFLCSPPPQNVYIVYNTLMKSNDHHLIDSNQKS